MAAKRAQKPAKGKIFLSTLHRVETMVVTLYRVETCAITPISIIIGHPCFNPMEGEEEDPALQGLSQPSSGHRQPPYLLPLLLFLSPSLSL